MVASGSIIEPQRWWTAICGAPPVPVGCACGTGCLVGAVAERRVEQSRVHYIQHALCHRPEQVLLVPVSRTRTSLPLWRPSPNLSIIINWLTPVCCFVASYSLAHRPVARQAVTRTAVAHAKSACVFAQFVHGRPPTLIFLRSSMFRASSSCWRLLTVSTTVAAACCCPKGVFGQKRCVELVARPPHPPLERHIRWSVLCGSEPCEGRQRSPCGAPNQTKKKTCTRLAKHGQDWTAGVPEPSWRGTTRSVQERLPPIRLLREPSWKARASGASACRSCSSSLALFLGRRSPPCCNGSPGVQRFHVGCAAVPGKPHMILGTRVHDAAAAAQAKEGVQTSFFS